MTDHDCIAVALADDGAREGHDTYLLIDSAQCPDAHHRLDGWRIPYGSLFEGTSEACFVDIAPLLVPLPPRCDDRRAWLLAWSSDQAMAAPCISWMTSSHHLQDLMAHFRRYHVVGLSEGQFMLMRWYDTRILPIWLACLSTAQAAGFVEPIADWRFVDRCGAVVTLSMADSVTERAVAPTDHVPGQPVITLDDQQYAMLLDASALDALLSHLKRVLPDEFRRTPKRAMTSFVSSHLQRAMAAGLHDVDRQSQYVLLALYTSGRGVEHAACVAYMRSPAEDLDTFHRDLQAMPDEVWQAGEPLWDNLLGLEHLPCPL